MAEKSSIINSITNKLTSLWAWLVNKKIRRSFSNMGEQQSKQDQLANVSSLYVQCID